MANWNGLQLTNKGIALQAKVQAGEELVITKLKLGSGIVSGGTDIKTLNDLIEPEQNLGIGAKEAVDDYCKISSTITNTELEAGYYVRELGVFAQDPDVGEILYMYTTDGAPDYLPAGGGSTAISQEFSVMIAVNDTDNVSVVINDDALATMGYVQLQIQQHNNDAEAHEAAFNAHNADPNAHTDKIASQTEAEAQSNQNNKKFMTPLRVYQAIVAYFTQFLAAAVFTGIVKAVAPAAASNDNSVPTTSWVRTCFESMAKTVAEILEIQWKAEATGYLLLGPYLGNLKILWGMSVPQSDGWCSKATFPTNFSNTNYIIVGCGMVDTDDSYFVGEMTLENVMSPNVIQDKRTTKDALFRAYKLDGSPVVAYLAIGV